jgi:hypothetical protein
VSFFVGRDFAEDGDFYPARSLHPHRLYSPATSENDIALIEVVSMTGVPTYTYNTTSMSGREGLALTWVGYGLFSHPDGSGTLRRRGSGHVSEVRLTTLREELEAQLPCSGDSGGPSFARIGGREVIVGVVSNGDERCAAYNNDTRVDTYATWISDTMAGGTTPNCDITGGDCDGGVCWPANDTDFICYPSEGVRRGAACDPDMETWGSSIPCADGSICIQISTDTHEGECLGFCTGDRDCDTDESCRIPVFTDVEGVGFCVQNPSGCNLTGNECPAGQACYPTTSGENDCFPSDRLGAGASCDPEVANWDIIPCDDGLICVGVGGGRGECFEFCNSEGDCGADQDCDAPIFRDIPDVGICVPCEDGDNDGYCADAECDDDQRTTNPGASERCDDGVDNNCNGAIDEGCDTCVDNDSDGYCADAECDDGNPRINPGAAEICNDGLDNNCDGDVDLDDSRCGSGSDGGPDDGGPIHDPDGGPDDGGPIGDSGSGKQRGCSMVAGERPMSAANRGSLVLLLAAFCLIQNRTRRR